MLFKFDNRQTVRAIILISSLILAGCNNSAAIEGFLSADSRLKEDRAKQLANTSQLESPSDSSAVENPEDISTTLESKDTAAISQSKTDDANTPRGNSDNLANETNDRDTESIPSPSGLPLDLPGSFPVYPQAQLESIESEDDNSGMLTWKTTDNRKAVADYYQAQLQTNDWKIIKPFTISSEPKIATAIALKDNLRLDLTLSSTRESAGDRQNTELSVIYHSVGANVADATQTIESAEPRQLPQPEQGETDTSTIVRNNDNDNYVSDVEFTDLDDIPQQLQIPLEAVAALGVLTPYTGEANIELSKFAPDKTITRGEYARWLIAANNRYYSDNPGKKIYIASKTQQPAFNDVKPSNPDFAAIQSLAEAGLIPSRLSGDSTSLLFRPDAPLTREDLITWKVPLDTRQSLPKASLEAIEESWGFQDATKIDSSAVRALYADFQNGDLSNVRRIFGYTTLFQPKKAVTRAEAAASLWYFGFQGDGITAQEVLDSDTELDS